VTYCKRKTAKLLRAYLVYGLHTAILNINMQIHGMLRTRQKFLTNWTKQIDHLAYDHIEQVASYYHTSANIASYNNTTVAKFNTSQNLYDLTKPY